MLNLPATTTRSDMFALQGGLNLVDPALLIKPGCCIDASNFEPDINGGYRLIDGYERFDGRTSPSDALYYTLELSPGHNVTSGSFIYGPNGNAYILKKEFARIVLTALTGTIDTGDSLSLTEGGAVIATASSGLLISSESDYDLNDEYTVLAQDYYRNFIEQVPGINAIRGIWKYKAVLYAFRDSLDGIYGGMWKSTTNGWVSVALGNEIAFNLGLIQIQEGMTITGGTSGATALVKRVILEAGVWGSTANGRIVISDVSGTFQSAELLKVSGNTYATIGTQLQFGGGIIPIAVGASITGNTSGATAVVTAVIVDSGSWAAGTATGRLTLKTLSGTFVNAEIIKEGTVNKATLTAAPFVLVTNQLKAGGRYDFDNYNFTGATDNYRMYAANGVNPAFEFDGTTFVSLYTGMENDTPKFVNAHENQLFLSFRSSVQHSGIGNPYAYTLLSGSAELAVGDEITGMMTLIGGEAAGAMAIFTQNTYKVLYGKSPADWNITSKSQEAGAIAYTAQTLSGGMYFDKQGVFQVNATYAWGDFEQAGITRLIQPLINSIKDSVIDSTIMKGRNQYKVFCSDGQGITISMNGKKLDGIMPFNLDLNISCVSRPKRVDDEVDELYYGGADGFVYKSQGSSFDGRDKPFRLTLPFYNLRSPVIRKRWRRANVGIKTGNRARIQVGYELGYANPDIGQPSLGNYILEGNGGRWDSFTWDEFSWDSREINSLRVPLAGTSENISLSFYGSSKTILPFVLQTNIFDFTARRISR